MDETFKEFTWYSQQYEIQIDNLEHKIEYLKYRNCNLLCDDTFMIDVFLDSVLVDVRAIMVESKQYKKNYTVQNSLKRGCTDDASVLFEIANSIDEFLNKTEIEVDNMTLYNAIKFYTDKFIAHRDSITKMDYVKKKELRRYFLSGEWSVINIVEQIMMYTKKCKYEVMVASLCLLTGGELEQNKSEVDDRNVKLERLMYDNLMKCTSKKIDQILHLKARGIIISEDSKDNEKVKNVFYEKLDGMNRHEILNFVVKIKESISEMDDE